MGSALVLTITRLHVMAVDFLLQPLYLPRDNRRGGSVRKYGFHSYLCDGYFFYLQGCSSNLNGEVRMAARPTSINRARGGGRAERPIQLGSPDMGSTLFLPFQYGMVFPRL